MTVWAWPDGEKSKDPLSDARLALISKSSRTFWVHSSLSFFPFRTISHSYSQ